MEEAWDETWCIFLLSPNVAANIVSIVYHLHCPPPPSLNLDLRNSSGETALWLALKQLDPNYLTCEDVSEYDHTIAAKLIKRGANVDAIDTRTGNSLLHQAALRSNEAAAVFLVHHGAIPNHTNVKGEAPIHIAATNGLHKLVEVLLQSGADPNLQTALKPRAPIPAPIVTTPMHASSEDIELLKSPTAAIALSALSAITSHPGSYSFETVSTTSSYSSSGGRYAYQPPHKTQSPTSDVIRHNPRLPRAPSPSSGQRQRGVWREGFIKLS